MATEAEWAALAAMSPAEQEALRQYAWQQLAALTPQERDELLAAVAEWDAQRPARQLEMLSVFLEEIGWDAEAMAALPENERLWRFAKAYEQYGLTLPELQGWAVWCDPPGRIPRQHPVECYRQKVRDAIKQPMSVPMVVGLSAAAGLATALVVRRLRR